MLPKAFLDRERKRTNHTHKRRVRRKKPGTVFCVITIKSNILNPFPLPGTSQILLLHHIALLLSHSYAGESIRRCMETNHRTPPSPVFKFLYAPLLPILPKILPFERTTLLREFNVRTWADQESCPGIMATLVLVNSVKIVIIKLLIILCSHCDLCITDTFCVATKP